MNIGLCFESKNLILFLLDWIERIMDAINGICDVLMNTMESHKQALLSCTDLKYESYFDKLKVQQKLIKNKIVNDWEYKKQEIIRHIKKIKNPVQLKQFLDSFEMKDIVIIQMMENKYSFSNNNFYGDVLIDLTEYHKKELSLKQNNINSKKIFNECCNQINDNSLNENIGIYDKNNKNNTRHGECGVYKVCFFRICSLF